MNESTNNAVKRFTDDNWLAEVDKNTGLTIVDVWAPWCGPCRIIGPIIEELANEYQDRVKIGKLNADENMKAGQLGVSGIPTILFMRNGKEIDRVVGAVPKQHLIDKLEYHLSDTGIGEA